MDERLISNLKNPATWTRLIFIALFAVAFYVSVLLVAVISTIQFILVLFSGVPNRRLQSFGSDLGVYIGDVVAFLTYRTEHKPYPVSDWVHEAHSIYRPPSDATPDTPNGADTDGGPQADPPTDKPKAAPKRKSTKRKPSRKKPADGDSA